MSKRREAYLSTSTMRATAHSLSLASSVLGFEIVELWSDDVDGKLHCTYVHCDEAVLKQHPHFNVGHYPQHKSEHILSPKLCELAKKSPSKYHWRILDIEGDAELSDNSVSSSVSVEVNKELNSVYVVNKLPFKTEMAYLVEGVTGTNNVYIVALSVDKKEFKLQKLKFLQGVAFAIYVAAFDLDEETADAIRKESTHELDTKEHLPTKPLIGVDVLSQANVESLSTTPPATEQKSLLGAWSKRHMSDASLKSFDKHTPRNLYRDLTNVSGIAEFNERQSMSSQQSSQSLQSHHSSREKQLNVLATSGFTAIEEPIPEVEPLHEDMTVLSASSTEGLYYDEKVSEPTLTIAPVPEDELAPTWVPTFDFSYPVSKIPILQEFNSDLRMDDFTNVVHFADGSNANVFSAYYKNKRVVIKMIKEEEVDNETAVREFDIEHGMLARMSHPNMITILGAGVIPRHFMVIEYLEGGILRSMMQENIEKNEGHTFRLFKKPTFTYANLLKRAKELAEVFNYMHFHVHPGASVLHRDLKPENVGFTEDGTLKLFDFGLATCVKVRDANTEGYEMTGCTGSLRYMAPEVALKLPYNEKVDVYSYGVLLWQMAKDRTPFKGLTKEDFMTKVAIDGFRPKLDRKWPIGFSNLISRCWAAKPHERPSFSLIIEELTRLISDCELGRWGLRKAPSSAANSHFDLFSGLAQGIGMSTESGSSDFGSNGKRRSLFAKDNSSVAGGSSTGFDSTGKGRKEGKDGNQSSNQTPDVTSSTPGVAVSRDNSGTAFIGSPKAITSPARSNGSWFY